MSHATTLDEVLALRSENARLRGHLEDALPFLDELADAGRNGFKYSPRVIGGSAALHASAFREALKTSNRT